MSNHRKTTSFQQKPESLISSSTPIDLRKPGAIFAVILIYLVLDAIYRFSHNTMTSVQGIISLVVLAALVYGVVVTFRDYRTWVKLYDRHLETNHGSYLYSEISSPALDSRGRLTFQAGNSTQKISAGNADALYQLLKKKTR